MKQTKEDQEYEMKLNQCVCDAGPRGHIHVNEENEAMFPPERMYRTRSEWMAMGY